GYTCPKAGTYAVGIRDREYRGEPNMTYRLNIGDIPIVSALFPLGIQRGTEADIQVEGVNLGGIKSARVSTKDAALGSKVPVNVATPRGPARGAPTVVVGESPETVRGAGDTVSVPGTANGRIDHPAATDVWRFTAKKGECLIVEVDARRLGS